MDKRMLVLALLLVLASSVFAVLPTTIRADFPSKLVNGAINISLEEVYNDIAPNQTTHFYYIKAPLSPTFSYNLKPNVFTKKFGTNIYNVTLYPILSKTVNNASNWDVTLGAPTTTINTAGQPEWLLAFQTANWKTDVFNFTLSAWNIDPSLSACGTIAAPGTYSMTQSITTAGTCLTITVAGVVIDGTAQNHYNISGTGGSGIAVQSTSATANYLTIMNANLGASGPEVINYQPNTGQITLNGDVLWDMQNSGVKGFYFPTNSPNVNVTNCTFNLTGSSIGIFGNGQNVSIVNSTFLGGFPIVLRTNDGGTHAGDNQNWTLANNTFNTSQAFAFNGYDQVDVSFPANLTRSTFFNNTFNTTGGVAVFLQNSSNLTFNQNGFFGSSNALNLTSVFNATFTNNTFGSTGATDVKIGGGTNGPKSNNLSFYYNNFTQGSGVRFMDEVQVGNNVTLNTTVSGIPQGNFWADIVGLNIFSNGTNDGLFIGLSGAGYPYSSSSSSNLKGTATDSGPLFSPSIPSTGNVFLTPTPSYYNTVVQGLANVAGMKNATAMNWTLFVNGTNYTSGNATNLSAPSLGFYPGVNVSLFNLSHFTADTNLTLSVAFVLSDNSIISYTNSSNLTISKSPVQITSVTLTPSVNVYPNATLTCTGIMQDNDTYAPYQPANGSYFWYNNTANQTGLAVFNINQYNGTANSTTLSFANGFGVGDSWICGFYANDSRTVIVGPAVNSSAVSISSFITNLTMNSTTSEYDLYSYSHGINFTAAPGITISGVSATLTGSGSTFAGTLTSSSGGAQQWNVSIQPPFSSSTNNYTLTVTIRGTYANGSAFTQSNVSNANTTEPYSVQVNASGIYACNSSINTPTINYSTFDQSTLASINATYGITYSILSSNGSLKLTTVSFTNNTQTVCIGPSTASFSANATESLNASGYQGSTVSEVQQFYNSSVVVRPMFLINSSAVNLMTITVQTPQQVPFANYVVQLYRYIPATNSYNLTNTGVTNGQGQTVQSVLGPPTTYAVLTYDNLGNLVQNLTTPAQIFCSSVPLGSTCSYNIIIGTGTTTYYTSTTNYFDLSSLCSFSNATNILTCTYSGDPVTATYILNTLNLTAVNGSAQSGAIMTTNATAYSTSSIPSHTITVTIPNVTGNYPWNFMGYYVGSQNGSTLTGYKMFAQGVIQINIPTTQNYGKDGWFMVGILCLVMGLLLAAAGGPLVGIVGCGGTILLSAIAGFIYLDPLTFGGIAILTLIVGLWAKG